MNPEQIDIPAQPAPISDQEFTLFQKLIYREAGIHLAAHKKTLLEARLNRYIRKLGLNSFGAYYRYVVKEHRGHELIKLLDLVSTNETHFFREPRQFEFLEEKIFPRWKDAGESGRQPKRLRLWSAGCSTGEEPYSLAMLLLEHFPPAAGWQLEILASDLSTRALEAAQTGVWPIEKAKEIPQTYLRRFMLHGQGENAARMKARPELGALIQFQRLNLNGDHYPVNGLFDAIFCRNVMIYFDAASRARTVARLLDRLHPAGYLFIGHAESLNGVTDRVYQATPTVYRLNEESWQAAGQRFWEQAER